MPLSPSPERSRLAACGSAADEGTPDSGPIKIGVVVPLTGPFSPLGLGDKAAIEQEVKAINDAGGVLGRDLEVTIKDDKTDVPQSVTEFNQLAADPSYSAILSSSFVSASTAAGPSAESNKIPTISLGPVSAFADGSNPYAFTGVAIPEVYAQAIVDYVADQGYESLAIGYTGKDVYGDVGNEATLAAAENAGVEVVLDESFDPSATDFSPLISKVKAAEPGRLPRLGRGSGTGDHHQPVRRQRHPAPDDRRPGVAAVRRARWRRRRRGHHDQQHRRARPRAARRSAQGPGRRVHRRHGWSRRTPIRRSSPSTAPLGSSCSKAAIEKAGSADREEVRDALESLDVLTPTGRFTFSEDDHAGLGTDAVAIVEVQDGDFKATPYSLERFKTDLPE